MAAENLESVRHQQRHYCPRPQARLLLRQLGRGLPAKLRRHLGPRRRHRQRSHLRLLRKPSRRADFWTVRALELFEDAQQFGTYLVQNPVVAFQYFFSWELFDIPIHIEEVLIYLVSNPLALAVAASPALASAGGLAGLAGLAAIPPPPAAPAPLPIPPPVLPAAGVAPTVAGAPGVSIGTPPSPTSAATVSAAPSAPPPAPPPPAGGGPGFAPPYVVGGPTIGAGMSLQAKTQEPTYAWRF